MFEHIKETAAHLGNIAVVCTLFLIAATAGIPSWRASGWIPVSAFCFGLGLGLVAKLMGAPYGIDVGLAALGVLTGPFTITKLQGKSLDEAIKELAKLRDGVKGKDDSSE